MRLKSLNMKGSGIMIIGKEMVVLFNWKEIINIREIGLIITLKVL